MSVLDLTARVAKEQAWLDRIMQHQPEWRKYRFFGREYLQFDDRISIKESSEGPDKVLAILSLHEALITPFGVQIVLKVSSSDACRPYLTTVTSTPTKHFGVFLFVPTTCSIRSDPPAPDGVELPQGFRSAPAVPLSYKQAANMTQNRASGITYIHRHG